MSKGRKNRSSAKPRGGSFGSSYVRNSRKQDKNTERMSVAMRVLVVIIVLSLVAIFTAFVIWYLVPFIKAELAMQEETSAVSEVEVSAVNIPVYDDLGLEVYGNDFNLQIINSSKPADINNIPETDRVNGINVNRSIADAVRYLVDAAKEDSLALVFEKGYISFTEQEELYEAEVERMMAEEGMSRVMARTNAKDVVPVGGESDFQTGLCIKIKGDRETFVSSQTYEWLSKNMTSFGFVFRFPAEKSSYTGSAADYTIIRYVGRENAEKMVQLSMCLEEYIDYLKKQQTSG